MEEQSHPPAHLATGINNPLPESPVTQPDVTAALSNIDNKMGRLTD